TLTTNNAGAPSIMRLVHLVLTLPATEITQLYTLSLHDALPISGKRCSSKLIKKISRTYIFKLYLICFKLFQNSILILSIQVNKSFSMFFLAFFLQSQHPLHKNLMSFQR